MMDTKKQKSTKNCVIKRKIKLENCKNCLEATQLENKINHLEKNQIAINSIKKLLKTKNFIKNNKLILQTQQKFKSEKHNVFTEETNKISNGNKRI